MIDFDATDIEEMMKPANSTLEEIERAILKRALNNKNILSFTREQITTQELLEFAAHFRAMGFNTEAVNKQLTIKWRDK